MKLFWIAAFYTPKKNDKKDEQAEAKIIVQPEVILADSEAIANMKATRKIPKEYENFLEQVTVAVSPF